MNKAKVLKTFLSFGGTLLMGIATLINNKVADDKMKEAVRETVAEEIKKQLTNQVKES